MCRNTWVMDKVRKFLWDALDQQSAQHWARSTTTKKLDWAAARDTIIALFPTSSCCIYNKLPCRKQQLIAMGKLDNLMNVSCVTMDIVICLWDAFKWKSPVPIACCPDWLAATSVTQKLMCKTHTWKEKEKQARGNKKKKENPPALLQRD